jgi:ATP-dependent helicase/nuclease subunit B
MPNRPVSPRRCEFWLGRAGSGKTYGCLDAIARELQRSPRGEPLLILVPEQASAQIERRLATWPGLAGGFTRARVLSFNHLMREAFARAGGAPGRVLGEVGRVILLRRILDEKRAELAIFGPSASRPGTAESVAAALLEFQRYGWRAADLAGCLDARSRPPQGNSLLTRKLRDLSVIWAAYDALLARLGWADPSRRVEAAAAAIRDWQALDGARVWIDGFASFTDQELALLEALVVHAQAVVLALCVDPEQVDARDEARRIGPERLFETLEETYHRLRARWSEAGWTVAMRRLPAAGQPTRFSGNAPLAHLESRVLGRLWPERFRIADRGLGIENQDSVSQTHSAQPHFDSEESSSAAGDAQSAIRNPQSAIELIEAEDRRAEVEAVARRIVLLCRHDAAPDSNPPSPISILESPTPNRQSSIVNRQSTGQPPPASSLFISWRDVAVLARDLGPYETLVREVFAQFSIPCFLDRPRQIQGHPLARMLASALEVLASGWAGEPVMHHLKSGLSALRDEDAVGRLETWVRARAPRGAAAWRQTQALAESDWIAPLRALETELRAGDNPARALWGLLEATRAAATLEAWIAAAQREGREEQAQIHEQAWDQTIGWLEELGALADADPQSFKFQLPGSKFQDDSQPEAGDAIHPSPFILRPFPDYLDRLAGWVEAALGVTRARLVPPTLNQVTVGAVDRSRTPDARVVFVLGLNEGSFPRLWSPDAVLGDADRAQLADEGRRLGPDTAAKRRQEYFLAYIALTRASHRLVACRPLVDENGKACDPSVIYRALLDAYPDVPRRLVGRAGRGEPDALPLRPGEWALRIGEAVDGWRDLGHARPLAEWMAGGSPLAHDGLDEAARCSVRLAMKAVCPARPARLESHTAHAFWSNRPTLHVTGIESFHSCPFQFYAARMLRLEEAPDSELTSMELGTIRHVALERLFTELKGPQGLDWGAVEGETLGPRLAARALSRLRLELLARDLKLLVRALRRAGRDSGLRQVAAEWRFDREDELTIEAAGVAFNLHGTIDRIDAAPGVEPASCVVYDYKSGVRKLSLAKLLGGVELQLPLYGLALRMRGLGDERRPVRIGGFFYWPLSPGMTDPKDQDEGPKDERDWKPETGDRRGVADVPQTTSLQPTASSLQSASDPGERWFDERKPSGLFEEHLAELLDGDVPAQGRSLIYGFRRKKDGALYKSPSIRQRAELDRLLDFVARMVRESAARIADGEIAARPYLFGAERACDRCAFRAVCRLAEGDGIQPRPLRSSKAEIENMFR